MISRIENIEGRVTCVTRPSTVDKPNREARSARPTQAPPLKNAQCFACKGCYITSRKGYSTSGPGKVTIHRPGLSPLPPMNVPRLITFAETVSRSVQRIICGFPPLENTFPKPHNRLIFAEVGHCLHISHRNDRFELLNHLIRAGRIN